MVRLKCNQIIISLKFVINYPLSLCSTALEYLCFLETALIHLMQNKSIIKCVHFFSELFKDFSQTPHGSGVLESELLSNVCKSLSGFICYVVYLQLGIEYERDGVIYLI